VIEVRNLWKNFMPSSSADPTAERRYLSSFAKPCNIAVIGATGGIGGALLQTLSNNPTETNLVAISRGKISEGGFDGLTTELELENENSIIEAANFIKQRLGSLSAVYVATGLLHEKGGVQPEKSSRNLDSYALDKLFRVNAIGPALIAKHFIPLLKNDSKAVFACLSARVGSIKDNYLGGWYAYRASKASLNMILKTLSIELSRTNRNAICVGLHPGTVDTSLSKPFQTSVTQEKLFTPERAASALLSVVDNLNPTDTGQCFAWDGETIPF
jgi:NAD(P)-dependent dehydrogenase (short-subunit alcohol dehydrogenase family)